MKVNSQLLDLLPSDVYKKIISYIFVPKLLINRTNPNIFVNKCLICHRNQNQCFLMEFCSCNSKNMFTKCQGGCINKLICYKCTH